MPIYQREPYRSDLTGTIADLILRQGQIRGQGEQRAAEIQANAALQRGQNRAELFGSLGQLASGAVQGYFDHKRREQELAPRREMEQLNLDAARRESDAAREADWNKRAAQRAVAEIRKGNADAVLAELPEDVRSLAQSYLAETDKVRKHRQDLLDAQRVRSAQMIVQFGYDPTAIEIVAALNDDDPETTAAFSALKGDPAKFKQLVDSYAFRGKTPTITTEDPTKRVVSTSPSGERTVLSEGVPEIDKRTLQQQANDANARGDTAEYQRLLRVIKETGQADDRPRITVGVAGGSESDPKLIAQAIINGDQPPTLQGLYRLAGPVRAELSRNGYDLTTAMQDWNAATRHIATLNGPQQTRLRQAAETAYHSLDIIDELSAKWKGGKFPVLNRIGLSAAKNGALGQEAQAIATQLEAQISDLTSELGNVYMGGNSPTDHSLQLAAKNLSADWSEKTLKAAVELARKNLQIRLNSIRSTGVIGPSDNNPYLPTRGAANPPAQTPTGNKVGRFEIVEIR